MKQTELFAGVDVGTTTTKAVIITADKQVIGSFVRRTGADLAAAALTAFEEAAIQADIHHDDIQASVATGYGRKNVAFVQATRTEISCHGRGCYYYYPERITVVDIGGQDSKIIKMNAEGKRTGFKMNRKCAAGTGAFLEEIAHKLDIPVGDLNARAMSTQKTAEIGSYCTVFTATEVLDRIRAGENIDEIVRGLFDSITKRVVEMDALTGRVVLTGGVVAHNSIVRDLLSQRAGIAAEIAPHPQEMGAFGAALFAAENG